MAVQVRVHGEQRHELKGRVDGVSSLRGDTSVRNVAAAGFDTISNVVNTSSLATRFARRRENIMWTGHVLHVVALYETLTSDDKFSRPGGLAVTESDGKTYRTDAKELALHVAACMRINATGGVPCEPGLVFFQCQNHPFCAFTLLEGLDHFPRGFFDPEKRRFQAFAAKGFRAVVETGGIKIACVTTRQNGPSFDDAYGAELRVLEARLEGADDAQPGESSSRVLASLPFAHIGSGKSLRSRAYRY